MWPLGSVPLVSVLGRFYCNTNTFVMWTLDSVPLVSVLRWFDCNTGTSVCNVAMWLCPFGVCVQDIGLQ